MKLAKSVTLFSRQPKASILLAALFVLLGVVLLSGVVPDSTVRRYFPGHDWLLAGLCLIAAIFVLGCAMRGLRSRGGGE